MDGLTNSTVLNQVVCSLNSGGTGFVPGNDTAVPVHHDQPPPSDDNPALPLIFTYPLLILAFIIIVLGGLYFFYRRQHQAATLESEMSEAYRRTNRRPRRGRRDWFGSRPIVEEEETDNASSNDSTVDFELPSYEQHSWNSRWASTGRSRGGGEAGEIIEVVNLRGENGENVPVAVVRHRSTLSMDEQSLEEKKPEGWFGRIKNWRGQAKTNATSNRMTFRSEIDGEWSVEPPEYVESSEAVAKPEMAVVR
jgi:hypothetical protein